jgi:beta-lactamase regulating signal transducer with metallopeptidase domain
MNSLIDGILSLATTTFFPVQLVVKSTLILAAGAIAASALRSASASTRHAAWALTLAGALSLPIGMSAIPALRLTVARSESAGAALPVSAAQQFTSESAAIPTASVYAPEAALSAAARGARAQNRPALPDSRTLVLALWLTGALAVIGRIVVGYMTIRRIGNRAPQLSARDWLVELRDGCKALGVENDVRLVASSEVLTPMTSGLISPVILLPAEAHQWSLDHRRVVIRHELAHIAGKDAFTCLVAGLTCGVYWFNPLVWIAARGLRAEQERACDDRVLSLGTPPADYATHLLEVARSARAMGMSGFISMAMARPSQLEGRLLAVLNVSRSRQTLGRRRAAVASAVAVGAVSLIASFQPIVADAAIVVQSQAPARMLELPPVRALAKTADAVESVLRADSTISREIAVSPGGTIDLDLDTGAGVTMTTWDEPRLRMRAVLGGRDWRRTEVELVPRGSGAMLTMRYRPSDSRTTSSSHRVELTVPRRFNMRIHSAGGDIDLRNIEGTFTGSTGGGAITIERARGHADLSTGGGGISVSNSHLSGAVSTGGGGVILTGITGGLRGSSGSGQVIYGEAGESYTAVGGGGVRRASDNRTIINKAGGSISIADAPGGATITTGGGAVTVGRAGGSVSIGTGGGDVQIGPVKGRAEASTGAGAVTITVDGNETEDINIKSGSGPVTILVPRNFSADLDLETAYTNRRGSPTRIVSPMRLDVTETSSWDSREGTPRRYVRVNQAVGGGGRKIRVRTVNGDIIIRER